MTTAAGPTAASASATTAPHDSRELPSWGSSVGLLASLGGQVQVHYAVKVRKLRTVDQDGIPSSIQGQVLDPFFNVVDLHALFTWGNVVLEERCVSVVLCHMGEAIFVEVEILAVTLIDFRLEGRGCR